MARSDITLHKADTILGELERLRSAINQRAYDLFQHRGEPAAPEADWLNAERDLVWQPAIELRQKDGEIELLAATAGVEPRDLDVEITPEDVLIKADIHHTHSAEEGTISVCEFNRGQLFRSVHLPERIDPDTAAAEYRNGLLRVKASIAKPRASKKVEITAA
jgi:HSP20 family protein